MALPGIRPAIQKFCVRDGKVGASVSIGHISSFVFLVLYYCIAFVIYLNIHSLQCKLLASLQHNKWNKQKDKHTNWKTV